jgi:hypothetical protein
MGLVQSSFWERIGPFVVVERVAGDKVGGRSRVRIELSSRTPPDLVREALAFTMPCVACGKDIFPFRKRNADSKRSQHTKDNIYFAAACPLRVNVGCSRSAEARTEYESVRRIKGVA